EDDAVKVVDFGLARILATDTPVKGKELTIVGGLVGTVAYMSPEQAEGKEVDERTDVFALGVLLYEMSTGHRPFQGGSPAAIVSSLLRDEPRPVDELNAALPKPLVEITRSCLQKDPGQRLQTANEVRDRLEDLRTELASEEPRSAMAAAAPVGRERVRFGRVGVVVLFAIGIVALYFIYQAVEKRIGQANRASVVGPPVARRLSQLTTGAGIEEWPAWSPDGARIAYAVKTGGFMKLFVKDLESGEVSQITHGSRDDIQPEWSHDGSALLFVRSARPDGTLLPGDVLSGEYTDGDIWRVELGSGEEQKILENAFHPAVSPNGDRLAFDASWAGPRRIWVTDSRGHNPAQVTTDVSEAVSHTQPRWSPDGAKIVYQYSERTRFDIKVVDPATKVATWVTHDGFNDLGPVWSPSGRFIYFSSY
ncbi:MAG: protein kinase, partial [Acidobacteriota bacterium]|nr:protein kinase [Acidobacteriota bacterium]